MKKILFVPVFMLMLSVSPRSPQVSRQQPNEVKQVSKVDTLQLKVSELEILIKKL